MKATRSFRTFPQRGAQPGSHAYARPNLPAAAPGAASTIEERIRSILRGQRLLIVGGDHREQVVRRLHQELGLAEAEHCPTRKADPSGRSFTAELLAPENLLVVWVRGLSRTNHGTVLHQQCRQLALPWIDSVRIPHPHTLLAGIERLHLVDALQRRRELITRATRHPVGGAA